MVYIITSLPTGTGKFPVFSIFHRPDKNRAFSPIVTCARWELAEHLLHGVYSAFDTLFPSLLSVLHKLGGGGEEGPEYEASLASPVKLVMTWSNQIAG